MALYGSKAIRGHGIPEAMEQILINESNIKPSITFLKPISSAIAIGTGGPFGAEGPIIATGGALGSTLGQLFKVTANERKIILAAGATAGMSAIFGTPIAAIFLAIELLLFEFSPKSILPVALACITGAAGHHLLFESGPVFPMPDLAIPSNLALGIYSFMGIILGLLSVGITKIVYAIEDAFEKLPIHWMWWPAIGGLVVGLIGYFAPHTLGVGYDNITGILSGSWPLQLVVTLCLFKFLSWAIALGSGTSGGTLAPLLTIGGACGAIIGSVIYQVLSGCRYYPAYGGVDRYVGYVCGGVKGFYNQYCVRVGGYPAIACAAAVIGGLYRGLHCIVLFDGEHHHDRKDRPQGHLNTGFVRTGYSAKNVRIRCDQ
jgi:CIC family chloride channel protein